MSTKTAESLGVWTARFSLWVWIGIALNLVFVVLLCFFPAGILDLLHIPLEQKIWARIGGWLLFIITCYYVPMTLDLQRYRANAWLSLVPSRGGGASFFFVAVFIFGQPPGFLSIALVDAFIGLMTLWCLIKIEHLETALRSGGTSE